MLEPMTPSPIKPSVSFAVSIASSVKLFGAVRRNPFHFTLLYRQGQPERKAAEAQRPGLATRVADELGFAREEEDMRALILSVLAAILAATAAFAEPGFSVDYRQGYKILEVKSPWPGFSGGLTYVLYPRGSPKPAGIKADAFFEVPLRRVVTFSTTYIPQIAALGEAESIVGVDNADYVSTSEVRSRIAAGKTVETTRNGAPNMELLISLAPDAVFTYGMGNEWDMHPKLAEAKLPVVISGEWNETDPLARAEWIEFIAAFYDKEALASAYFDKVAEEYKRVRALAAGVKTKPTVFVNGPFQGTWTVSGGGSYMARFLADAGSSYLWASAKGSGGLTLSVEAVYDRARKADFWLNPGIGVNAKADIAALDARLASLPAVAAGRVWNNTLRLSPGGGSDYFESAILNPDKVLTDLVKIFHPELLTDKSFSYYKNVGK
jgi:iron complex transport system substrate-binding protein